MPTAWTTPTTFTATVVTVANLNTNVRDNTTHLKEQIGNARAVVTKTGTYTATTSDGLILCNGTFTINLPTAASVGAGWVYQIKNIGTGTVTIDGNASETIDGQTTIALAVQYDNLTICSDGSNWLIL